MKLIAPFFPETISYQVLDVGAQHAFDLNANKILVRDLTEQQANEYAELCKQQFLKHWQSKKNEPVGLNPREILEGGLRTRKL